MTPKKQSQVKRTNKKSRNEREVFNTREEENRELVILSDSSDNEDTCRVIRSNPISLCHQRVYDPIQSIVSISSSDDEPVNVSGKRSMIINSDDTDTPKKSSIVYSVSESDSSPDPLESKDDLLHSILEENFNEPEQPHSIEIIDDISDSSDSIPSDPPPKLHSTPPRRVGIVGAAPDTIVDDSPDAPAAIPSGEELQRLALEKLPYFRTIQQLRKEGCKISIGRTLFDT